MHVFAVGGRGGTGRTEEPERGWGVCPIRAQCILGLGVVTPQLGHLLCSFVLVPLAEPCPTGTCDHRDLDITLFPSCF